MKNILIADDHSLIRLGLRMVLEGMNMNVTIEEAWDAVTIMGKLQEKAYELILLDIKMPATDSVVLMHWIQSFHPHTRILIVSQNPEDVYGKRYLQLGANGFIAKTASDQEMIKAITKVLNGDKYISEELSQSMMQSMINGAPANPFDQLSQREFQVVICLARGCSMNEVTEILHVQYSTAHTHKRRAFEKLNIQDSKELAKLAGAYNMLD